MCIVLIMYSKQIVLSLVLAVTVSAVLKTQKAVVEELSSDEKNEFHEVFNNGTLTKGQVREGLNRIFNNLNDTVRNKVIEARNKAQQSYEEHRNQQLSSFSQPARDLSNQIEAIKNDDGLTRYQTCQKIQALIKEANNTVVREIGLRLHDCNDPNPPSSSFRPFFSSSPSTSPSTKKFVRLALAEVPTLKPSFVNPNDTRFHAHLQFLTQKSEK